MRIHRSVKLTANDSNRRLLSNIALTQNPFAHFLRRQRYETNQKFVTSDNSNLLRRQKSKILERSKKILAQIFLQCRDW